MFWGAIYASVMMGSREVWPIVRTLGIKETREVWLGLEKTTYVARLRITGSQNHVVETAEDRDHNGSYDHWKIEMNSENPALHIVYTTNNNICGCVTVEFCGGECAEISYPNPICASPENFSVIRLKDQSAREERTCYYYDYDHDSKIDAYKMEKSGATTLWHIDYQDSLVLLSSEPNFEQEEWLAQSSDSKAVYVFHAHIGWEEREF